MMMDEKNYQQINIEQVHEVSDSLISCVTRIYNVWSNYNNYDIAFVKVRLCTDDSIQITVEDAVIRDHAS
jgi:hypothetical protein